MNPERQQIIFLICLFARNVNHYFLHAMNANKHLLEERLMNLSAIIATELYVRNVRKKVIIQCITAKNVVILIAITSG